MVHAARVPAACTWCRSEHGEWTKKGDPACTMKELESQIRVDVAKLLIARAHTHVLIKIRPFKNSM